MGLYVHSLGELPIEAQRAYYVYLLDYGWKEPFGDAVRRNLPRMADVASRSNAVVIHGPRGMHFEDDVLSWHHVNGQAAERILPAILVTTRHPAVFRESHEGTRSEDAPLDAMLLIPLKRYCKTPEAVVDLIDLIFTDIQEKKALSNFRIAKEMHRGVGGAIVDAVVLQPNFAGIGIDIKVALSRLFNRRRVHR